MEMSVLPMLRWSLSLPPQYQHTPYSNAPFICVRLIISVHGCFTAVTVFGGFAMLVGAFSRTRYIFTHLFVLFICVRLIISVHGCFTAVTGCQEPSQIVVKLA